MPSTANRPGHVTRGSVLDDLGLTEAEVTELRIKGDLWRDLMAHIEPLGLTQKELAKRLHVHQPDVSNLISGKLSRFSVESFISYALRLGLGFEAKFTPAKPRPAVAKKAQTVAKIPRLKSKTTLA